MWTPIYISATVSPSACILLGLFLRRSWLIQENRERHEAGRSLMAWGFKSRKRNMIISIVFRFLIYHDLALVINLFYHSNWSKDSDFWTFLNIWNLTSSDLSWRKPQTQAATDTGETKKSGMKTRSQKWLPLSILSHTSTSNISSSKWMPTAISMALNSTHVSPSALKRDRRRRKKTSSVQNLHSEQVAHVTPTYMDTLDCICKSDKRQREIRWKAKLTFLFKGQSFKLQRTTTWQAMNIYNQTRLKSFNWIFSEAITTVISW